MTRGLDGVVMAQFSYVCCTPSPRPASAASQRSVERPGKEARHFARRSLAAGAYPSPDETGTPTCDDRVLANIRWLRARKVSSKPTNPGRRTSVRLWTGDLTAETLRYPR